MTLAFFVLFALALWFATKIPKTIAVFVVAAFVASAVHPVVQWLELRRISRVWAITIVFTALIAFAVITLVVVVPMTVAQIQVLLQNTPVYLHAAQTWLSGLQEALRARFPELNIPPERLDVQQLGAARITALLSVTIASLGTVALNLATGFFVAFSALILSFFFLLNNRQLADGFAGLFPPSKREAARQLSSEAVGVFGGYIAGQVIVSGVTGLVIAAVTAIFGFKYALLIGILSAIGYAIPIIGMLAAQVFALALAAPQGIGMVLFVEAWMFVVARISDNVLVPRIMGGAVGVSPITVMFAVFAGGELFGLPGLILGIPAAAIARLVWRYFLGPWFHGQMDAVDESATQMPAARPELPEAPAELPRAINASP
jgi:predicted PurR-regulated permease PerM